MNALTELESKALLQKHGIPITKHELVHSPSEATKAAKRIGFPVVAKIVSKDILHKTEAKGVLVDLQNETEVSSAYNQLLQSAKSYNAKAKIDGVLIQEQVQGIELIIGVSVDPQFGPTIMFGLGGIFVEVLKDVTFRVIPIQKRDAEEMLTELKSKAMLEGVRGGKPVDKTKLVNTLLAVSKLLEKNLKIQELDINPLFASSRGVVAADARIILK